MAKQAAESRMCIPLGDKYYTQSNAYTYVLVERKTIKTGIKAGTEQLSNVGYFQSLGALAKSLINKEVRESEIKTLEELDARIRTFAEGLGELLKQSEGK